MLQTIADQFYYQFYHFGHTYILYYIALLNSILCVHVCVNFKLHDFEPFITYCLTQNVMILEKL